MLLASRVFPYSNKKHEVLYLNTKKKRKKRTFVTQNEHLNVMFNKLTKQIPWYLLNSMEQLKLMRAIKQRGRWLVSEFGKLILGNSAFHSTLVSLCFTGNLPRIKALAERAVLGIHCPLRKMGELYTNKATISTAQCRIGSKRLIIHHPHDYGIWTHSSMKLLPLKTILI